MKKLIDIFFYQGMTIPLWGVVLIAIGLLTPGHDSISQHLSLIGLGDGFWASALKVTSIVLGISISLFALSSSFILGKFSWQTLPALAFGLGMITNGIYETGNPMHGLYGMVFFSPLVPLVFSLEFKEKIKSRAFEWYSIITAFIGMIYMWLMLTQLDPEGFMGLTQRLFLLQITVWFGVGLYLLKSISRQTK